MVGIAPRWWPAPGSRAVAMAAIAALSVAAPVEPAVAAEAPRIGVELPSGASMGDHVPLRVTVPPLGTGAVRVGIDLSSGLRPLGLPAGCAFIGQTWTIACTVEAGDGWEADLPHATGRNDATQRTTGPDTQALVVAPSGGYHPRAATAGLRAGPGDPGGDRRPPTKPFVSRP